MDLEVSWYDILKELERNLRHQKNDLIDAENRLVLKFMPFLSTVVRQKFGYFSSQYDEVQYNPELAESLVTRNESTIAGFSAILQVQ